MRAHNDLFAQMVVSIGNRMYYDLTNWYRLLTFFPGYRFSAPLMEKMMGVETSYVDPSPPRSGLQRYGWYLPASVLHALHIMFMFGTMGVRMRRFSQYAERTLHELNAQDLDNSSMSELKDAYFRAEQKLLRQWRVPIANDFAVMVSTGLVDTLLRQWVPHERSYELIQGYAPGAQPLASLDPSRRLQALAAAVRKIPQLSALFQSTLPPAYVYARLKDEFKDSEVTHAFDAYIQDHGTRMPNELKLESETLREHPEHLVLLVRGFLAVSDTPQSGSDISYREVFSKLSTPRALFLRVLLRWSHASVHRREQSRLYRAMAFGHIRSIFIALGHHFEREHVLMSYRDVFYLTTDEVFDLVNTAHRRDVKALVESRKQDSERWQRIEPPRRIETTLEISLVEKQIAMSIPDLPQAGNALKGRVASRPSKDRTFRGVALTITEFDPTAQVSGKILVTRQTDPGWTVLFPLIEGVVVERGGMLSHAAIVARELNIPCIVGVTNATRDILSGASIELDLEDGVIREIA